MIKSFNKNSKDLIKSNKIDFIMYALKLQWNCIYLKMMIIRVVK